MKAFILLSGLAALATAAPFPTGFPGPTAGGPPSPFPIPTGSGLPFPAPTGGFSSGPFANGTAPPPGSPHPSGHHGQHHHHPPGSAPLSDAPAPLGTAPPTLAKRQFGGAGGFSWPSISFATPTGGFDTGSGSGFGAGGSGGSGGFGFSSVSFPAGAVPTQSGFGGLLGKRQFSGLPSFSLPAFPSGSLPALPSVSLPTGGAGLGGLTMLPGGAAPTAGLKDFRGYQGHISAGDNGEALTATATTTS